MATNEKQSSLVPLEFSEDAGVTWLVAVCRKSNDFNLDVTINEEETDCGTALGVGEVKWGFNFDGIVNTAPTSGSQASFKKFLTWANSKTLLQVRQQAGSAGADWYKQGSGYLSGIKANYQTGQTVSFSASFKGTGALDITP
jgi:hypothetical protein